MQYTSVRPADDIEETVNKYSDMIFRICLVILKNSADAQDAVQETFIKYIQKAPAFESEEHKKAWLIKVATNKSRDMLRLRSRQIVSETQDLNLYIKNYESEPVIEILASLPEKFKTALMLYYVEDYKVSEIAEIIGKSESVIKKRLQKGRKLFEEKYRKEFM